ncbi:MAG: BACON domain-containing carbohydrate-binding protein [Bryobacteraceae bacterium]
MFFNAASTAIHVVVPAPDGPALAHPFALETISLANPAPCAVSLSANVIEPIGEGGYSEVGVTASPACVYQSSANAGWITIVSGGYGGGNGTLRLMVRPNAGAARSGTVTIAGQTITVNQAAAPAVVTNLRKLAFNVVDTEYDKPLDRFVMVSAAPNELHLFDPLTHTDRVAALAARPSSVSVRPDGLSAAVGHDGFVSIVNLQTMAVESVIRSATDAFDIVYAGNGYSYVLPLAGQGLTSVHVATGTTTFTSSPGGDARRKARLRSPKFLYLTGVHNRRFRIDAGVAQFEDRSLGPGCSDHWLSEFGDLLFTGCGQVLYTDDDPALDMDLAATFSGNARFVWLDESDWLLSLITIPAEDNFTAPVEETTLRVYGEVLLRSAGDYSLPRFPHGSTDSPSFGRFVFWNRAADRIFALVQADPAANLPSNYAMVTVSPGGCPVTTGTANVTLGPGIDFAFLPVTAAPQCVWTADSSASWLIVLNGAFSFGSTTAIAGSLENSTTQPRTATLTLGDKAIAVTQQGRCEFALNPAAATFGNLGGSGSITVTPTAQTCSWSATSDVPWITRTSSQTVTGSGTLTYAVGANNGGTRTGTITVGAQTFTVTQLSTTNSAPFVSGSPTSGTGLSRAFTFTFTDNDGAADLDVVNVLINNAIDGRNACYLAFVRSTSTLVLVNDAGAAGGPFAGSLPIPGSGVIANGQCAISGAGSSASVSGNTLTLVLNVTFQGAFAGNRIVHLAARDVAGNNTGWLAKGVWTVPGGAAAASALTVNPARATASAATMTLNFPDVPGFGEYAILNVLINNAIDGRNACYLAFIRDSSTLVLVNDAGFAGGPFAGSVTVPGAGAIANSQCTVTPASFTDSGAAMTLTLGLAFHPPIRGSRIVYTAARDANGNNTGWQAVGTIDIP